MKILLFGGSGTLGQELLKIDSNIIAPSHRELNINDGWSVIDNIRKINPDIVINAAAITSSIKVDKEPIDAIRTNIVAAAHIANACITWGQRLIYISTDYIYKGDRGDYKEEDEIHPFNQYAWTKLGGECSTRAVKNHLIIRTSFGTSEFPYYHAFSDKKTSKDYVDIIAPMIYKAAVSELTGVLNIGTNPKTMYEYAKKRNPNVHPIEILKNTNFTTPKDSTLNLDKWNNFFENQ